MLGLMIPTWFLSMWISNTAATSMMIPIIQAVVHTLEEVHRHACMLSFEADTNSICHFS